MDYLEEGAKLLNSITIICPDDDVTAKSISIRSQEATAFIIPLLNHQLISVEIPPHERAFLEKCSSGVTLERSTNLQDPFGQLNHLGPFVFGAGEAFGQCDHPRAGVEILSYIAEGEICHVDSLGHDYVCRSLIDIFLTLIPY